MANETYVMANDVKKGDTVRCKDGSEVTVEDNKTGIIRRVTAQTVNGPDTNTMYIDKWYAVKKPIGYIQIKLSEQQRAQMKRVRASIG
jgi:hypothetical protein